jgi:glycosyltransferase involved in cell wall biosynthesis
MNDLQHVHHPEFFDPADWKNRDELYRDSTAKARHVICISEFTRRDMHRLYGVPLEKMTTIWPIPGESVRDPPSPSERARLLAGMGISAPFLFFPAHGWVHKNHARLVGAFARVAKDLPDRMLLLLTGRPFASDHPAALRIREAGMADRIVHLGYRTADEVRTLLHECHALIFPSLFEGFGVPVADAIIAGRPVACSNATSLPEVAGEAALFFDPLDVDGIAAAILDIATQGALRDSLVGAAQRRRRVFSPGRVAEETLAVYDRALRG